MATKRKSPSNPSAKPAAPAAERPGRLAHFHMPAIKSARDEALAVLAAHPTDEEHVNLAREIVSLANGLEAHLQARDENTWPEEARARWTWHAADLRELREELKSWPLVAKGAAAQQIRSSGGKAKRDKYKPATDAEIIRIAEDETEQNRKNDITPGRTGFFRSVADECTVKVERVRRLLESARRDLIPPDSRRNKR
jgi:hypothetical protein